MPAARRIVGARSARLTGSSRVAAGRPGAAMIERHAQRRVVQQHAVRALAMVAEPLAVIAGDHDERAIHQAARAQRIEDRASCESA